MRLAACAGVGLEIIEPCGFPLTDKALRRAAMDYGDHCRVDRRASLAAFVAAPERRGARVILIETDGATGLFEFNFAPTDTLVVGRESAGSPPDLRAVADAVVRIPMAANMRSMNVAMAASVALYEALRQTRTGMNEMGEWV